MLNAVASLLLAGILSNEPRCVKWTWTGDVYNRKITCLEWTKPPPKPKDPKKA